MDRELPNEAGSVAWLIKHGWEVYDTQGERVGDVEDVRNNHLVVSRGFLFTAERYIPVEAIHGVEDDRVFLTVTKDDIEARGWDVEPPPGAETVVAQQTSMASTGDVTALAGADPSVRSGSSATESANRTWDEAMPGYQSAWQQGRGTEAKTWADVEPSYRFGFDMAGDPRFRGRDWDHAQHDLEQAWVSQHRERPWDDVAGEVRTAWENALRG